MALKPSFRSIHFVCVGAAAEAVDANASAASAATVAARFMPTS
jgi:hypothetical protein